MLLQVEGFDHYGAGNFHTAGTVIQHYFQSNGFTVPTGGMVSNVAYGKRTGSLGVRLTSVLAANTTAKWIEKDVRPEQYKDAASWGDKWENLIFFRFAFRIALSLTGRLVFFRAGGVEISVGTDWNMYVKIGSDTEVNIGYPLELNIWNFMEVEFNKTENKLRIWMNDFTAYEVDLLAPVFAKYEICAYYATGGTAHAIIDIDDISINDGSGEINNDRLGKTYVQTRYPTSDDVVQMSRSAGAANYLNVNEATPNNDTNYVFSHVPGATDLYKNTTPIDAIDDSAVCAVVVIPAARMVEPDALSITAVVKSGDDEQEGGRMKLKAASYTSEKHIFEVDPSTNMRWTPSDVEAASFGVRILDRDLVSPR